MPELPEVETIARDLTESLIGQKVVSARFFTDMIREDFSRIKPQELTGKTLIDVSRRGKNLIFNFSDDISMVCHLKMTGRLLVDADSSHDKKHLHFEMQLSKSHLSFYDVRKFGRICIIPRQELKNHPRLSKLGPEPFAVSPDEFVKRVKHHNKTIKQVLLDQTIIAGLGNIYADESLYDAGIRPTARPKKLSAERLKNLHKSIIKILNHAIKNRGTSVDDYLDGHGNSGNFQNLLKIYGKTDQTCPICGGKIKRIVLGGRSTHYCPKCQK